MMMNFKLGNEMSEKWTDPHDTSARQRNKLQSLTQIEPMTHRAPGGLSIYLFVKGYNHLFVKY